MFTDPIADYLTRVRNAQMARLKVVNIPSSNMKKAITKILHEKGYILNFKFEDTDNNQGNIKLALKYNSQNNLPAIRSLQAATFETSNICFINAAILPFIMKLLKQRLPSNSPRLTQYI